MLIPVFVSPAKAMPRAVIADLAAKGGKVTFRIVNEGNVYVRPDGVKLAGLGADGKELFQQELAAWYVLAEGRRDYEVTVPANVCPSVRAIQVTVGLPPPLPPEPLRARLEGSVPCGP
jgi:hypothetical protein